VLRSSGFGIYGGWWVRYLVFGISREGRVCRINVSQTCLVVVGNAKRRLNEDEDACVALRGLPCVTGVFRFGAHLLRLYSGERRGKPEVDFANII